MSIFNRFKVSRVVVALFVAMPSLFLAELAPAAVSGDAAPSVTVRYYDLNLNSPEGVARLYGRIRGAAEEVCRSLETRELDRKPFWNDCFDHAVAKAVKAVHNAPLSAYHWQRIRGWKFREIEAPATAASR